MTTENEIVDKSSGKESQSAYYFSCPSCGRNAKFYTVREIDHEFFRLTLLPWHLFEFKSCRVQCAHCGLIFRRPPYPSSPVATALFWLVILVSVGGVIGFVMGLADGVQSWAANDPIIRSLQKFAAENSLSVTLCAAAAPVLFFTGSFLIAICANARHRSMIRKNYAYRPMERERDHNEQQD